MQLVGNIHWCEILYTLSAIYILLFQRGAKSVENVFTIGFVYTAWACSLNMIVKVAWTLDGFFIDKCIKTLNMLYGNEILF